MAAPVELVLKASGAIRKWHHAGQATFGKKLERAIDGGKAYLRVFFSDQTKEFVGRKMIARFQKSPQNCVSLISVLQTYALQVAIKNLLSFTHGFARWWSMIVNPSL